MTQKIKVACIQFSARFDFAENIKAVEIMVREAAGKGAQLIATPENTDRLGGDPETKLNTAYAQEDHPIIALLAKLSQELKVWILCGSVSIKTGDTKLANRELLFSPEGKIVSSYDKIHMFDVDLPNGEKYRESDLFAGGDELVLADVDGIKLGLTICYDVRFSYLYRALAQQGAQILTIPAAFTVPTGEAHWEVLLRARAIETGSFVIAPAQTGEHDGGRKTWGHSMIIDPWGRVLADAGKNVGIIYADLNMEEVSKARNAIPALTHDRPIQNG